MKRDALFLTVLVGAAFAFSCFQVWYVSLPIEKATEVRWCQFSKSVDCLRSLGRHGHAIDILGAGAVAVLFGLLFAQFLGCALAWTARDEERDALFSLGRALSFPSSAVAFYILFQDLRLAEFTSLSTLCISFFGLVVNVLVVARGLGAWKTSRALSARLGIVAVALASAFFVDGALKRGRLVELELRRRDASPPAVHWPRKWQELPRTLAARIGAEAGSEEWLVFLDPRTEESRRIVVKLLGELRTGSRDRTIYLYAPGDSGRKLMEMHARGNLADYLGTWDAPEPTEAWSAVEQARIDAILKARGVTYPTIVKGNASN